MPSSPTAGRKLRLFRGDRGGHSRQAPCSARTWIHFLYGVIAILLFAIVLLSRSQGDPRLRQVGCGAAEDTLHSRVELPKVVEKEAAADEKRPKVLAFVGIQTGFTSAERRRALRETWLPSTPEGITRYGRLTARRSGCLQSTVFSAGCRFMEHTTLAGVLFRGRIAWIKGHRPYLSTLQFIIRIGLN